MVNIVNGNLLEAIEDIICHQANEDGVMGGGLAYQIASQYPEVEKEYINLCKSFDKKDLIGLYQKVKVKDKIICNCFTQKNFNTQYYELEAVLKSIKEYAKENNLSVALPFNYGCGIANGDWTTVYNIIEEVFKDYKVTLYKLN